MNREEVMKVIATLRAAYPTFYKALSPDEFGGVIRLWEIQFSGESYKDVVMACHSLISSRTNNFPPTIGELKQALHKNTHPDDTEDGEAWERVMKCICRGSVHSEEDWKTLDPITQETVSPAWIKRQAESEDFVEGVARAQFIQTRQIIRKRRREADALPQEIAQAIRERLKAPVTEQKQLVDNSTTEGIETAENAAEPPKQAINIREFLQSRRVTA